MTRAPIKRQTLSILKARGVPVRTVIDVGVLYGTPELLEAYPSHMHLLIEPVAEFAASIEHTYRNTPHRLIQAAASDKSGHTSLNTMSMIAGQTISHSQVTESPQQTSRTISKISLDDYLRDNPAEQPYLLKIDVDGHEMSVLRGATETLKHASIVMVEVTAYDLVERVGFVQQAGFRLFDLAEPCYYDLGFWQCDAVLVRSDLYPHHFTEIGEQVDLSKYEIFGGG